MTLLTRLFRLLRIHFILMRYHIDEMILDAYGFYPLRFLVFLNPYYWIRRPPLTRGERIRCALEDLGPIFVKAGQLLSTRCDLLPEDIANELAQLQDRVPPFPGEQAKAIVETALGDPIETIFAEFHLTALASASIAQVHTAVLQQGETVVVKVLRPHIKKIIDRDIDLLTTLARIADRYSSQARHFKPKEIIAEIAQTLYDELDLLREGANASQLRRHFHHSPLLYIPMIYWEYSHSNVLVMERITGIPIHDTLALQAAQINMKKLAERGIEIFFTQVFRDRFFHADLHPGNLFVAPEHPEAPQYKMVDFGIVGSLSQNDQRYLAENMMAFFKRDYQRVAELHIACGWLSPDTRIDQFEGAIRSVSEPIFSRPLRDISFGQLLLRLFQVAHRFHINIQPQLILLQKTLLNIEALCRQLSPELDLWTTATPQIEKWLKQQVGTKALFRRIYHHLPRWSEQLPDIPTLLYDVLYKTKQQQEKTYFTQTTQAAAQNHQEKKLKYRYFLYGIVTTICITGLMILILKITDSF